MVMVTTPITMIAPARTAATPDWREAMFWKSEVASVSKATGRPRT